MVYFFIAIGFPPGGSGQYTFPKIGKEQLYTKRETIHKTIQKHRIHKSTEKFCVTHIDFLKNSTKGDINEVYKKVFQVGL
jgi:hypothetical protein